MPQTLDTLYDLRSLPFDDIIDVRSPSEYAEDHIPGAISLPVLSDEERARVGTIYVQQDPFLARKIGAALVARNAAAHIEGPLTGKSGGWRPLIYCWRGGQRSGSFTMILKQIGWRADTVDGGYKAYRRMVVKALYDTPLPSRVVLLNGGTGTAKTRLLTHLARQGAQVIDLEGLACHRGSLFGEIDGGQPSQKAFESRLAAELVRLDPDRPVFVEAESSRVGALNLPPVLWKAMREAQQVRLSAPIDARVTHLVAEYQDYVKDPEALDRTLQRLVPYHGHKQVDAWQSLAAAGALSALTRALITRHYDPRYTRISGEASHDPLHLRDLSDETLDRCASGLIRKYDG
ncbi:tRNA 2-selenouridine(34) synthase MnmH [Qingshengfaniella alkalisoli]|uniref:tRNA 2-selenouridine(34) synthase MnmH n=1 Tax=Qingshengfaniella alkalisoli TaxID=2599296 RepID=A0A5B8IBM9_9RHOB|nr:tRNA 2-selenouridine(34) synthase MnmH [Qingshengfaniella alkalisoli]QDY70856.1 tRNA 2-selenouridine(34) synthase MnmH [Qingshengfaniella alkalisoli]